MAENDVVPVAGTGSADAGGSGAPPAEAPPSAPGSEDGERKVEITSHEYVTLKQARENEKRLAEENAQLKADRTSRGTPPTPAGGAAEDAKNQVRSRERYIERLRMEAAPGPDGQPQSEAAAALIAVHESALAAERRTMYRLEMFEIPEGERDGVKDFMASSGLDSPALARQFMRGERFGSVEQENIALKARVAALEAKKPPIEGTRIIGEPPIVPKKETDGPVEVTPEEYAALMADPKTVNKTIADRRAKKLVIKR